MRLVARRLGSGDGCRIGGFRWLIGASRIGDIGKGLGRGICQIRWHRSALLLTPLAVVDTLLANRIISGKERD